MSFNYRGREKLYPSRAAHQVISTSPGARTIKWASEAQREAFEYGPAPLMCSGGFGSSKTTAAVLKILYLMDLYPGYRVCIARRVWDELKKTTMVSFFQWCPPEAYNFGGRRADSDKILRLNNGSELIWLHLDNPDTEAVVRGLEINAFFVDQAEELEEEMADLLLSRLGRWMGARVPQSLIDACEAAGQPWPWRNDFGDPIPPAYGLFACNPDHELHWIYRKFHPDSDEHWEKKIPERNLRTGALTGRFLSYADKGYRLINFNSLDNRYLNDINRQELLSKSQSYIDKYVLGKWGNPKGKIHHILPTSKLRAHDCVTTQVNNHTSVQTPIVEWIKQSCALYRTLDHGDSSPTCCLWMAADTRGNIFFYREYYKPGKLIVDHRAAITQLSAGEQYDQNLADPSIFHTLAQKQGGKWSVADEYRDSEILPENTVLHWAPADNNELGTRDRINELLRVDPNHRHPITGVLGAPHLYFIEQSEDYPHGCYEAVRETAAQQREKVGTNLGEPIFSDDRDENISDHAHDCVRYGVAARPSQSPARPGVSHPQSFDQQRKRAKQYHKRGGPAQELRNLKLSLRQGRGRASRSPRRS